jgi:hypothetical protein
MRVTSFEIEDQDLRDRIVAFMARFKIGALLNRACIRKLRGVKPLLVLRAIFDLAFMGRNILMLVGTVFIIWLFIHTQLLHERKGEKEFRKK